MTTPRRRVPRLRVGDPGRSGTITTMTEGVVVRRDVFDALGGWEAGLFLHHEGLDLSSRCWAAGWTGWYAAGLRMHHPPTSPARHALFHRLAARNRITVAHRNLPHELAHGLAADRPSSEPPPLIAAAPHQPNRREHK
ncbi:glycosyltransferase family 2 protein [Streptomyces sp. NPDC057748]|uniref:glycosyltransferase family 2 protein n=1 Tax=unclassified Streptomyces TaxID=2593676 RepID=UPI00368914E6